MAQMRWPELGAIVIFMFIVAFGGFVGMDLGQQHRCDELTQPIAAERLNVMRKKWQHLREWFDRTLVPINDDHDSGPATQEKLLLTFREEVTLFRADQQRFVFPTDRPDWLEITERLARRQSEFPEFAVLQMSITVYSEGWTMHRVWGLSRYDSDGLASDTDGLASDTKWFRNATSTMTLWCGNDYWHPYCHLTLRTDDDGRSVVVRVVLHREWVPLHVVLFHARKRVWVAASKTVVVRIPEPKSGVSASLCYWIYQEVLDHEWMASTVIHCTEWHHRVVLYTLMLGLLGGLSLVAYQYPH